MVTASGGTPSSRLSLWNRIFGIDVRTLALFRIGLALAILNDLRVRFPDIGAFYTDSGVLNRTRFLEIYSEQMPNLLSLHLMSGLWGYQALLFLLAAVCACCLLAGYKTRLFTFLSWALLISLQNRNAMILFGGDTVLRMLAFWGCFLPLGAVWSLDGLKSSPDARSISHKHGEDGQIVDAVPHEVPMPTPVFSVGTVAILLQMCFIYWFAAILKREPEWHERGTAVFYALSIGQLSKPLAQSLLASTSLLRSLTFLTIAMERFAPIFILLPLWRLRMAMVLVCIGFHVGMALCLTLGLFPWVMALGWCLFIPREFWELVSRRYDAMSNSGTKSKIEAVRERAEVVRQNLAVPGQSAGAASFWAIASPRLARAFEPVAAVGTQVVAAFFLLYILAWNYRTTDFNRIQQYFPTTFDWIGEATRVDQQWGMFAPKPTVSGGWLIVAAQLENGTTVDLFHQGAPVSWEKPANVAYTFPNERWQKYALNLVTSSGAEHVPFFGEYLVRSWNANHSFDERVMTVNIYYMREDTNPYGYKVIPKKVLLWSQKY